MDISINVGYFGPHISEDKDLIKKLDDIGAVSYTHLRAHETG